MEDHEILPPLYKYIMILFNKKFIEEGMGFIIPPIYLLKSEEEKNSLEN